MKKKQSNIYNFFINKKDNYNNSNNYEETLEPTQSSSGVITGEVVLGKQAVKKLKEIPMAANTVKRKIEEMADDIENQVIIMVKNSPFYSIQLGESTDVSNKALLLCFVRVE